LEEQPFRYHAALSDLSGSDIMSHSGSPERIVYCVRKWVVQLGFKKTPQAKSIWYEYQRFLAYVMLALQAKGMTEGEAKSELSEIPISEFLEFVDDWQSD
jgi:hypothetical protein